MMNDSRFLQIRVYQSGSYRFQDQQKKNPKRKTQGKMQSGDWLTLRVLIPRDLVGAVIGRAGNHIQSVREKSGAKVSLEAGEGSPGDAWFAITGSRANGKLHSGFFIIIIIFHFPCIFLHDLDFSLHFFFFSFMQRVSK
jgi:hypothetical protein